MRFPLNSSSLPFALRRPWLWVSTVSRLERISISVATSIEIGIVTSIAIERKRIVRSCCRNCVRWNSCDRRRGPFRCPGARCPRSSTRTAIGSSWQVSCCLLRALIVCVGVVCLSAYLLVYTCVFRSIKTMLRETMDRHTVNSYFIVCLFVLFPKTEVPRRQRDIELKNRKKREAIHPQTQHRRKRETITKNCCRLCHWTHAHSGVHGDTILKVRGFLIPSSPCDWLTPNAHGMIGTTLIGGRVLYAHARRDECDERHCYWRAML